MGTKLLRHRRNGFTVVSEQDKDRPLKKYWSISVRQIETSVVLADEFWRQRRAAIVRPGLADSEPSR